MSLNAEIIRAENAESTISLSVIAENNRAVGVENGLNTSITFNTNLIANVQSNAMNSALVSTRGILASQSSVLSANTMAIAALQGSSSSQGSANNTYMTQIAALQANQTRSAAALAAEVNRAQTAESSLTILIAAIPTTTSASMALANEVIRATAAEAVLTTGLSAQSLSINNNTILTRSLNNNENVRAVAAELTLTNSIATETSRAQQAEAATFSKITVTTASLQSEQNRAYNAEQALGMRISNLPASSGSANTDITLASGQGGALLIGTASTTGNITIGNYSYTTTIQGNLNSTSVITDTNSHDQVIASFWFNAFGGTSGTAVMVAGNIAGNVRIYRSGSIVSIQLSSFSGSPTVSNTTAIYSQLMPAWACPPNEITCSIFLMSNGNPIPGALTVSPTGLLRIWPYGSSWVSAAGIPWLTSVSYMI